MIDDMHDYGVYAVAVDIVFDEEELEDSDGDEDEHANTNNLHKLRHLTDTERQQIYEALLERNIRGKLKKNTTNIVARMFQVSKYQVRGVWRRVKQCRAQGIPVDVTSRRRNCGRKRIQIDLSDVLSGPLCRRRTIQSLANAIGVKKSTLHRWFKEGLLRCHSSTLKPLLREDNKKERLRWCLSMLDQQTLPNEPKFIEMDNIIHMDEKWFNITSNCIKFYLLPEEDPHRTENSIDKVMILAAVARPIYDGAGNYIFDGKIGVWAFVRKVHHTLLSRSCKCFCATNLWSLLGFIYCRNQQKEEVEIEEGGLKSLNLSMDRATMRSYMIGKVLDAIVRRWPREHAEKIIWIPQDNAPAHVPVDDEEFAAAVAQTGLDIRLINQPANSPDLNVLDLGFLNSLQFLTY